MIGMIWTAMACDEHDQQLAGMRPVPRSYYDIKWFLGGKVEQDREKGIVRLNQEQYCNDVLKRFQMSEYTPVDTPCEANLTWQFRTARRWIREMWMWFAIINSSLGRACI